LPKHNTGLISTVARPTPTVDGFEVSWVVPDTLDVVVIKRATIPPTRSATIETRRADRRYRRR
jgi:hypothetical protein